MRGLDGKVVLITARRVASGRRRGVCRRRCAGRPGDVIDELGERVAASLGAPALRAPRRHARGGVGSRLRVDPPTEGRLDVLVNNAGILRFGSLLSTTPETFLEVLRVNELGPFLGMRAAAPC